MTKIKAVVSILLIMSLLFGFAACGKDKKGTDETTTAADTTAEETTAAIEDTTAATDETTPTGETQAPTEATTAGTGETQAPTQGQTQPPANSKFPIGTDKAAIVNFYNTAANAVKAYKGPLKVTRKSGAWTSIEKFDVPLIGGQVRKIAEEKLPNDWATAQPKTLSFNNGVAKDGDKDRTLQHFMPPEDKPFVSQLTADGIKSAECKQEGANAKVTIILVEESSNNLDFIPPHHSKCADTLALSSADLDPFTIKDATVTYKGAKIVAVINEADQLLKLTIEEPAYITGKVGYGSLTFPAALNGGYNVDISIQW